MKPNQARELALYSVRELAYSYGRQSVEANDRLAAKGLAAIAALESSYGEGSYNTPNSGRPEGATADFRRPVYLGSKRPDSKPYRSKNLGAIQGLTWTGEVFWALDSTPFPPTLTPGLTAGIEYQHLLDEVCDRLSQPSGTWFGASLPHRPVFDDALRVAVSSFQMSKGLKERGIIGDETWRALGVERSWYWAPYRDYPSDHDAMADLYAVVYSKRRSEVFAAASQGQWYRFSAKMYDTGYYGGTSKSRTRAIDAHFSSVALHLYLADIESGEMQRYQVMRRGKSTEGLWYWQRNVGVTGEDEFGPKTEEATRQWQSKRHLVADGVVGPRTWAWHHYDERSLNGDYPDVPHVP